MLLNAYAVFDSKAAEFAKPFFLAKEAMAIRGFADACNDPNCYLFAHPEDYVLHHIGTFDTELGLLESGAGGRAIVNASSLKRAVLMSPQLTGAAKVIADRSNGQEVPS